MGVSPEGYYWLAGSLTGAVAADWGFARLLLELLRPSSGFVFWVGRAAKAAALLAWILFFNAWWYPRFAGAGQAPGPMILAVQAALLGVLVLAAVASHPRSPRRLRDGDA
jgi:hypothetical protein